ncbi:AfsA-related hotdog domain-containing protein [Litorimonas taeanensis]|nr:AfsA-related hotdog domain-containing protein [Litorimonas taeanensis]
MSVYNSINALPFMGTSSAKDVQETSARKHRGVNHRSAKYQGQQHRPVTQRDVHKVQDQNRLISWLEKLPSEEGETLYRAKVRILPAHAYFFEHDRHHIPGLYIIEAGRQIGLAIPHLFFDVGYDQAFVLDGCEMHFQGFANLSDELFIEARVFDAIFRKDKLQSLSFDGTFYQKGAALVRYQSHIRLFPERLLKRYEKQLA